LLFQISFPAVLIVASLPAVFRVNRYVSSGRTFTITICPGPLVHSMGKMSWRNDNGEAGLVFTTSVYANLGRETSSAR